MGVRVKTFGKMATSAPPAHGAEWLHSELIIDQHGKTALALQGCSNLH